MSAKSLHYKPIFIQCSAVCSANACKLLYISIDKQRFRKLVKQSNCRKVVNQLGKYGDGLLYLFKIALFTCSVLKYSLFMAALVFIYLNGPFITIWLMMNAVLFLL